MMEAVESRMKKVTFSFRTRDPKMTLVTAGHCQAGEREQVRLRKRTLQCRHIHPSQTLHPLLHPFNLSLTELDAPQGGQQRLGRKTE